MRHEVVELPPDELTEQADRRPRPLGRGRRLGHSGGYGVPGGAGREAAQAEEGRHDCGGGLERGARRLGERDSIEIVHIFGFSFDFSKHSKLFLM